MCEYIESNSQHLLTKSPLESSSLTNATVELFRLLSKRSKYMIAQQLSAWLIGPRPGVILVDLSEDELEALGEEMAFAWLKQASGSVQD